MMQKFFAGIVVIAGFLLPAAAYAQAVTGTIVGSLKDSSGAAVPGAAVTVVNPSTGLRRIAPSDSLGEFVFPLLPAGSYNVSAEVRGFKTLSLAGVLVSVDQKTRADLTLQVGEITEAIQVVAVAPLAQADSSDISSTVNEAQIRDLPLNGRNFVQLTRLIPGVLRGVAGSNIDGSGSQAWRASASFSANGMRTRDNSYLLDGIDNNDIALNSVAIFPSVDALQEFKVQTSTFSAEFGRSMGGVVNLQLKSGTNQFHGGLFEFLRNDKLDANNLFNNKFGRPKPPFRQNQFGGTFGGPVRRDRTFFFMDYQGWRIREAQTLPANVPTELMRRGDFSELNRTIYDPLGQTPFAGNRIPAGRLDSPAKAIVDQLYPTANVPGQRASTGQVINNYLRNPVQVRQDDQFDVKIDQRFSDNNQFFARYSFERTDRSLPASLPHGDAGATFGAGDALVRAQGLALNDVHAFSPNWLNELRVGFSRWGIQGTPIDHGTNLAQKVGIPGVNISDFTSAMTRIVFTPADIQNLGASTNQPQVGYFTALQASDSVTYSRNRQTLKAGFNAIKRLNSLLIIGGSPVGSFTFRPEITSNCGGVPSGCAINPNSGFSFASFMLGFPSGVDRQLREGLVGERSSEYAAYFQDDIRVTRKLVFNVGLRYDVFTPYVEHHDRQSNFDPVGVTFVIASENATFAGGRRLGRALQITPKGDVAPRFGFAYKLFGSGETILRGGYGVFWNTVSLGTASKTGNPPYQLSQAFTTTLVPTLRLRDGIPPPPRVNPNEPPSGAASGITDPDRRDGYGQSWNLNIQRQFGGDFLGEIAYVGSKGTHLNIRRDINQAPPVVGVSNQDVNRPFIRAAPLLRSLAQNQSRGYSIHHSLQAKFTKRFQRGFTFLNSYTFGKTIDIASEPGSRTLNAYDFNMDRSLADFDVRHTFSSSWLYELPFGKGQRWAAGAGPVAQKLMSGWNINAIVLLRSGLPLNVTQQQGVLSTGTGNRPNRLRGGTLSNPTTDRWFDLDAFRATTENTGTYGNSGRNILSGPGQAQFDLSLVKNTRFRERFEHQLKFEWFNAFNHPQFAPPASVIGTASAGVVSALLFNTPMRQIQIAMKLSF